MNPNTLNNPIDPMNGMQPQPQPMPAQPMQPVAPQQMPAQPAQQVPAQQMFIQQDQQVQPQGLAPVANPGLLAPVQPVAQPVAPELVQPVAAPVVQQPMGMPMQQVMPEPVQQVIPEPVQPVVPEPVQQVIPEPVQQVIPEPVQPVVSEPVQQAMPELVQQAVPEPAQQVIPEPAQPAIPSAPAEPVAEQPAEAPVEQVVEQDVAQAAPAPEAPAKLEEEVAPEMAPSETIVSAESSGYDLGPSFHTNTSNLMSRPEATIQGERYRITVLTERLLRLEYSPTGQFNNYATQFVTNRNFSVPKYVKKEDDRALEIDTDYFTLSYVKNGEFYGGPITPDKNLRVYIKGKETKWCYKIIEAKNYFGNEVSMEGEKGNKPENRGLYSLDGFVSVDDSNTYRLDENGTIVAPTPGNIDVYVFAYNNDFGMCVQDYFKLTGMPSLIPRYALGNWWSRDKAYTTENIIALMDKFEKKDIPLSIILLDKDWHIRKTSDNKISTSGFTFNKELIPDPKGLIDNIHERGLKIGLSIDTKDGFHPYDEHYNDVASFLGNTSGTNIPIDVLKPKELDAFLKYGLNPLEAEGVDFFWNDSNNVKDTQRLWVTNHYMFENLARGQEKRGMLLARNGLLAPHRYPVLYAGRSLVGWDNFQSSSFFNLSASNIGACWWSHDIGGYEGGMEENELYIRSVQLGVFSPIMRFHSSGGQYYKREPWKWDTRTSNVVARYLRLRHQLTPYLYTEAYKYYKTGSMIFQPLYYYMPAVYDDNRYKNEYFFGSELLIAPILTKKNEVMNRTIHKFRLPDGMWYEFTTGKKYIGNKDYVSFYKEEDYPIFAKKGSIIPLSIKSNINNTSNPTDLEIHVFPGQSNTYRMYEDDGVSLKYQNGYYLITEIDYNYMPNNYTLIIRSVEGKSGIAPDKRNYKIRFRNTKYAEDVVAYFDTTQIEITNKYIDDNDFIVELNDVGTVGQLTINCKGADIEIDAVRVINEDLDIILSDLQIETKLKEKIAAILFSDDSTKDKRMKITKLKKDNLDGSFIKLFKMIIDYTSEL